MNKFRSFAPAIACVLVWLLLVGLAPAADAFDGESADPFSDLLSDVSEIGKNTFDSRAVQVSREPVGLATGRGFNPTGTVATAFLQEADCGNFYECNPDYDFDTGSFGGPDPTAVPTPTPSPTPMPTPTPDPRIYEEQAFNIARAEAVAWINEQQPGFESAPPPRGQVVTLKSFLWIHGDWEPATFDKTVQGVKVTINVTPKTSLWKLEESKTGKTHEFACAGKGHEYNDNPSEVSTCGHASDHSSDVIGDVNLSVAIAYELRATSSLADHRSNIADNSVVPPFAGSSIDDANTADAISKSFGYPLWVNEVLTFGIQEAGVLGAGPALETGPITPDNGLKCGIGATIAYNTVGLPLRLIGISCGEVLEVFETLKNGVVACAGGIAKSIGETVELLQKLGTDPVGVVTEGVAGIQSLITLAKDDPGQFVRTVGFGALNIDEAEWNEASDARKIELAVGGICATAFQIITGRASQKLLDLIPTPGRRPDGSSSDPEAPQTPPRDRVPNCNSFPSGTKVRTANGALVAIENIQPGDYVLAANPTTGQWSNELVIDQWSHIDTGHMTTATLIDGSTIVATDHHLFWVESAQQWTKLDQITSGDLLLTPDGIAQIADVVTHPKADTLVWELNTSGPSTFTVHSGTTDLLVHNADSCPFGNWSDRQRQDIQAGTELRGLDAVPANRLANLMRSFRSSEIFDVNGNRFIVDRAAMEYILGRHHPRYFDPSIKPNATRNTGFAGSATPDDIVGMMQQALKRGTPDPANPNRFTIEIDGIKYELAVDPRTGRVADHFAPQDPHK